MNNPVTILKLTTFITALNLLVVVYTVFIDSNKQAMAKCEEKYSRARCMELLK